MTASNAALWPLRVLGCGAGDLLIHVIPNSILFDGDSSMR